MLEKIDNKIKILALFVFLQISSFGLGLYSGRQLTPSQAVNLDKLQSNYTTKDLELQANQNQPNPTNTNISSKANNSSTTQPNSTKNGDNCTKIKGNISSKSKIYHMPGGAFYNRTQAEMCFDTEQQALAAGFVKSSK
ncbi:MAG: hypothetical protein R3B41_04130 [Candidatus Doudnabacteria bacterium]